MIITKRHKHRDQSPDPSPPSSHKLFVDYPYPILTELDRRYKQELELSEHSRDLLSLQWYKDTFHKVFDVLHNLHIHNSPNSIMEQSFRQAHINKHSSKAIVNNLQEQTKPTRIKRTLASSRIPPINDDDDNEEEEEKQNNKLHVRKLKTKFTIHHTYNTQD